jgi:Flp pilus assembly protein TadG
MKISFQIQKVPGARAQAMVEFALVLMILMVVLVGIVEVGRLMFIYAAVNNASREAARYGSAIGLDDSGNAKYQYCDGIREMARRSAFFTPLTTTIKYDHGPATSVFDTCDGAVDTAVSVNYGTDRVYVEVIADYHPMINLLPISDHTFTSHSARTILGYVDLTPLPTSTGSSSGPTSSAPTTAVPTQPGTVVPSDTPTNTSTPTATQPGVVVTMTPLPTNTPTLVPTITPTATVTPTTTETSTPTLTFTPTTTPTAMPGCDSITTSSIMMYGNLMGLSITNPHDTITVRSVQVVWNATSGGRGGVPLVLKSISLGDGLGDVFWEGADTTGYLTLTPSTSVTIPGNNVTSGIVFTFDDIYENQNNAESIVISLSTPGCEGYTIRKP